MFEDKINIAYYTLMSTSRYWSKKFSGIRMTIHQMLSNYFYSLNNKAEIFDTSQWIYDYFFHVCGIKLQDRKNNPAQQSQYVQDHLGQKYCYLADYIKSRVSFAIENSNNKATISKRIIFGYHTKLIWFKIQLIKNKEVKNEIEIRLAIDNYNDHLQHEMGKLQLSRNKRDRDKCFACKRKQYYSLQEIKKYDKKKYVLILRYCPCKKILLCSKKCHKYAWTRLNHRDCCSKKIHM